MVGCVVCRGANIEVLRDPGYVLVMKLSVC